MLKRIFLVFSFCFSQSVSAATVSWVDWSYIDSSSFDGVVDGVDVSFTGSFYDTHYKVSGGGTNFWIHPSSIDDETYTASPIVDNAPPDSDVIVMREAGERTITFSQAVVDPVMALLSVGRSTLAVNYTFDTDFDILSVGGGTFDPSGNGTLAKLPGNVLQGIEGHGLIRFAGTYSSITWSTDVFEDFHAIQVGVSGVVVPVPAAFWLFASGLLGLVCVVRQH